MGSLSIREIRRLADGLSAKLGAREISGGELYGNYFAKVPIPIIAKGPGCTVWIDRYYAAYQLGEGEVRYVYVAPRHACEELRACRASQGARGQLPPEIAEQLSRALKGMRRAGEKVWLSD